MNISNSLSKFLSIAKDKSIILKNDLSILDFGCGSGKSVCELKSLGYHAFGCDVAFKNDDAVDTNELHDENTIRLISFDPYSIPFEDNTFDLIISNQVFEHVQNYEETISELHRVLKPGGSTIHIFPSKYNLIEPHVYVPFSSIIKSYPWLLFWAYLGIRNKKQFDLAASDVAASNYNYLHNNTNYLPKRKITNYFEHYFNSVEYCESLFLKHSPRGRYIYKISKRLPFIPALYGLLRMRTLVACLPKKQLATISSGR